MSRYATAKCDGSRAQETNVAKAKDNHKAKDQEQPEALGTDEQAHPGVDHSHAPYPSQEDADIRLQRAQGDSRQADPQE